VSAEPPPPPPVTPDSRLTGTGTAGVPLQTTHSEGSAPEPALTTNLISSRGRWLTADERLWWDGKKWLPYRRITWNSTRLRSNPPEDRATLSRNLGIWCVCIAIVGLLISSGPFSIFGALAATISLYNAISFFRLEGHAGTRLPGSGRALAGVTISSVYLCGFLLVIVGYVAIATR
jgi:hypothetical protein